MRARALGIGTPCTEAVFSSGPTGIWQIKQVERFFLMKNITEMAFQSDRYVKDNRDGPKTGTLKGKIDRCYHGTKSLYIGSLTLISERLSCANISNYY